MIRDDWYIGGFKMESFEIGRIINLGRCNNYMTVNSHDNEHNNDNNNDKGNNRAKSG